MGKFDEVTGNLSNDNTYEKEYAKEVRVTPGPGNSAVLRFLDGPDSFMGYYISWILCDDDKIRPFIVENEFEGISLLGRMFGDRNRYYDGGFFETKKGQFGKVSTYQAKDPDLYKIMTEYWNPAYGAPATARPKLEFIYNVIHRNPEVIDNISVVWCQKEKSTKIVRLGQRAMSSLKKCVDDDGDFSEYDVNYTKEGTGKNTTPDIRKAGVNVPHVVAGFIKEEEKLYKRNDLKTIIKLSSAFYCLKHIPTKIKRMDIAMGTNFYAEFEKQAALENAQWQEKQSQQKSMSTSIEIPPQGYKQEIPPQGYINVMTPPPTSMQPSSQQPLPFDDSAIPMAPPSQEPPRRVLAGAPQAIPCFNCNALVPQGTTKCPNCNTIIMEPCAVCNNLISSKATVCPFCQAKYTVS